MWSGLAGKLKFRAQPITFLTAGCLTIPIWEGAVAFRLCLSLSSGHRHTRLTAPFDCVVNDLLPLYDFA